MTFKTRAEWELTGFYEPLEEDAEVVYPIFEAIYFGNHFIVDSLQVLHEDGERFDIGKRFFLSSVRGALDLIKNFENTDITHKNIALLQGPNISKSGDYQCSVINKIIHCEDAVGQGAWIFLLQNGSTVVDCLLDQNEDELKQLGVVYDKNKFTNYTESVL